MRYAAERAGTIAAVEGRRRGAERNRGKRADKLRPIQRAVRAAVRGLAVAGDGRRRSVREVHRLLRERGHRVSRETVKDYLSK